MDQAVQSIQIAATLAERFRTLASQGHASTGTDISAAELRIGEANQIYPEIWQHLDRARAVLAERGANIATYDAFRAAEPQGAPGVTRVAASAATSTHYAHKSAAFNLDGHARATGAIIALKTALPGVNWLELDRQDAAMVAAAGPLTGGRSGLWIGIVLAVAAAAGGGVYFATHHTDSAPDPSERIHALETSLAAAPCDGESLAALVAARKANHDPAVNESTYIEACEKQLTANPCDRAKLVQYDAMTGGAAQPFRDQCTSKGGTLK